MRLCLPSFHIIEAIHKRNELLDYIEIVQFKARRLSAGHGEWVITNIYHMCSSLTTSGKKRHNAKQIDYANIVVVS